MTEVKNYLPRLDVEVLVFNVKLNKWQIEIRSKSTTMLNDWSWSNSNKNHITHWQNLPSKPCK